MFCKGTLVMQRSIWINTQNLTVKFYNILLIGFKHKSLQSQLLEYWWQVEKENTKFMAQQPSSETTSLSGNEKLPIFYRTEKFITMLKRAEHWSLSWDRWMQVTLPILFLSNQF
jgi:hypothetical protein